MLPHCSIKFTSNAVKESVWLDSEYIKLSNYCDTGGKIEDYAEESGECETEVTKPIFEPTGEVSSSATVQRPVDSENQKRKRKRKKYALCLTMLSEMLFGTH